MKARNIAPLALVIFAGLFVSGCDSIWGIVKWAAISEEMDSILLRKYGLTSWIWWVAAACSLYLPMRTDKTRAVACSGLFLGVICFTIVLWQWLSWVALIGAPVALFFLAMPLLIISKIFGWIKAILEQGKKAVKVISEDVEKVRRQKGIKAEGETTEQWIRLFMFGLFGTLVWLAVLFGGIIYPAENVTGWHHLDLYLRIAGLFFAIISLAVFIHDAKISYWECPNCERTIFPDWFRNKEFCPHKDCGYFNPWVSWVCEAEKGRDKCLFENSGELLRCEECGTPRPGARKWLAIMEPEDDEEDDDIIDAEFTEHRNETPPRRQLPAPAPETIACRNCGNEISANAKLCGKCRTPTAQRKPAGSRKSSREKMDPADKYL